MAVLFNDFLAALCGAGHALARASERDGRARHLRVGCRAGSTRYIYGEHALASSLNHKEREYSLISAFRTVRVVDLLTFCLCALFMLALSLDASRSSSTCHPAALDDILLVRATLESGWYSSCYSLRFL